MRNFAFVAVSSSALLLLPKAITSFSVTITTTTTTTAKRVTSYTNNKRIKKYPTAPPFFPNPSYSISFFSLDVASSSSASNSQADGTSRTIPQIGQPSMVVSKNSLEDFLKAGPNLIPPDTDNHSRLEKEFYSMMREFADFSPKDIACVPDPRYRALYEGVVAGANEPLVMNAFSIVFEDLLPLRVAGRMMYRHLKSTMEECIQERDSKEQFLVEEHGFDIHTLNHGRKAFMAIMKDESNGGGAPDGQMTMGALIDSGIVDTIVELLEFDSFEEFVKVMDADQDEKITFEKFMVGLQRCKVDSGNVGSSDGALCDVNCDLSQVLNEIVERMKPLEAAKRETSTDARKLKYSEKFDYMLRCFEEWEELVPSGDGRMLEVLKGSFAGARNEKIVKALKIVYMDYSALRVGGDLVFKLMEKLVARRQRKAMSG